LLVADYLIQVSEICRANSQLLHFLKVWKGDKLIFNKYNTVCVMGDCDTRT
jgi:hypothetical protein